MREDSAPGPERARAQHRAGSTANLVAAVVLVPAALLWFLLFALVGLVNGSVTQVGLGVLGGAGLLVLAWRSFRRSRPRGLPMGVALDRTDVGRGGRVEMRVQAPPVGDEPGDLEIGVVAVERYAVRRRGSDGKRTRRTREANAYERWQVLPARSHGASLVLEIPADGPYSYDGQCLAYHWRVEARIPKGAGSGGREVIPIWVRP